MPEFHLPSKGTQWAPPKQTVDLSLLVKVLETNLHLVVHGVVQGGGLSVVPVLVLLAQQLQVPRRPL